MEPLTLIDARNPRTVSRWLDTWQANYPAQTWHYITWPDVDMTGAPELTVGYTTDGQWVTVVYTDNAQHSHTEQHKDRAALVAYVVAWARGTL